MPREALKTNASNPGVIGVLNSALKALARVARVLRESGTRDRIRAARDASAIYAVLNEASKPQAA